MPSLPHPLSSDAAAAIERVYTPHIIVNTPDGTRKPNGITPPPHNISGDGGNAGNSGRKSYGSDTNLVIRPYNLGDYDSIGTIATRTSRSGAKSEPIKTMDKNIEEDSGYLRSKSPIPIGARKIPRHEPGSAASFYGGTPPAFPPSPGQISQEALQHSGATPGIGGPNMTENVPGSNNFMSGGNSGFVTGGGALGEGGSIVSMAGPAAGGASAAGMLSNGPSLQNRERGLRAARVDTESALREYIELQQRVQLGANTEDKERLKRAAGRALHEVKDLRREINMLVKKKEGGRIGRFIVGGIVAGTIPIIKRFFKRPSGVRETRTEYAYNRSRSMVTRILDGLRRMGWTATIFMFVLAALYVFQAEVTIRIARTIHKRLKKLLIKMEEGERLPGNDSMVVMESRDLECLRGWRWRILLWSK